MGRRSPSISLEVRHVCSCCQPFTSSPPFLRPLATLVLESLPVYNRWVFQGVFQVRTQYKITDDSPISFAESMSKVCITALVSASLFFVADPFLAFKGGGPYGSEVTRGQDLTGKDFSGRTLIKQDFKTSILRQANFKGAKLLGASFDDSDLTGDDLLDANLRGAGFSLTNITKANLTNANLEGALVTGNTSFKGSIITCTGINTITYQFLYYWP